MNIERENFAWRPGIEGEREMRETELGGSRRKEFHTVMSEERSNRSKVSILPFSLYLGIWI